MDIGASRVALALHSGCFILLKALSVELLKCGNHLSIKPLNTCRHCLRDTGDYYISNGSQGIWVKTFMADVAQPPASPTPTSPASSVAGGAAPIQQPHTAKSGRMPMLPPPPPKREPQLQVKTYLSFQFPLV